MEHLFHKLWENGESDFYPCHMPGHKRRACGQLPEVLAKLDITEIDGFDNLHQPEGILYELQKKAALLYGADESFYLVNGSTAGILSAVSCVLPMGGHILMGRNCHRSAYHAAYLRDLEISFLYPQVCGEYDIFDGVTAGEVQDALDREPDVGAVLIVSPTYEGRISDIQAIARAVHDRGIPLIVDEAHGAHLGLAEGLAPNSCQAGADLVIHSVHKTLPALTQTALLHVKGSLIHRDYLKRFLHIYQTSSPSYLLMASIDNALSYVEKEGKWAFERFQKRFMLMQERLSACRRLRILPADPQRQDVGKLVISVKGTYLNKAPLNGKDLYDILREKYHLQPEMAAGSYVLAMFTVGDSEEGYSRMEQALLEIDSRLWRQSGAEDSDLFLYGLQGTGHGTLSLKTAWEMETESVDISESVGRYAGEFVNLYPPGVPVLAPGELIAEDTCSNLRRCLERGLTVQGLEIQNGRIKVKVLRNCSDRSQIRGSTPERV